MSPRDHTNLMTHHNHESHESMDMNDSMGMMKMYLHFGLGDLLVFKGLVVDTNFKMVVSCVILFLAGILLELMSYLRCVSCQCELRKPFRVPVKIGNHDHHEDERGSSCNNRQYCCYGPATTRAAACGGVDLIHCEYGLLRQNSPGHKIFQTVLYVIRTSLSLGLMLVAMTYNVCLIFAIIMGAGVGFYLFYRPNGEVRTICH